MAARRLARRGTAAFAPRVIRRLLPLLLLTAAACLGAQVGQFELTAEDERGNAEQATLKGNVRLRDTVTLVTADEGHFDVKKQEVTLTGNVVLTREAVRVLADKLIYRVPDKSFVAENVRLGSAPYYAEGASATGTASEITVHKARISYGEPGPWQPTLTADSVTFAPGQRLRSEGAFLGIGHGQVLPFPHFEQNLAAPFVGYATINGGYRSSLGVFAEAGLHVPVALGVRLGGDLGLYSNRGVLVGPSGSYTSGDNGESYRGFFRSGYINDHGDKKTDVLGRPVREDRAFFEWQHQSRLADNLTLAAQVNWWRDSEVLRDFRPRDFYRVQEPDTFIESVYTGQNYFVSAFARLQPNKFERVQKRLPEVRFDLLPTPIGNGFVERFNASFVRLREEPLPNTIVPPTLIDPALVGGSTDGGGLRPIFIAPVPESYQAGLIETGPITPGTAGLTFPFRRLESDRLDAYYALERPIVPAEWLTITPIAGGRMTHYKSPPSAGNDGTYTRLLGEVGVDAALRASGTFAYKNERWKIDGLRHLFTPRLSYRYMPQADKGRARIPRIDRQAFSTYLQPLGLGDVRNIDDLRATNTLRLELDNTLQTRDPVYGARDLVVFNVANDFRFKRLPAEHDVSEIHTDLALLPATWLQLDVYQSFAPQNFTLRELNTGITLRDGNMWSMRLASNYLSRQLNDYAIDGRFRLNEAYELLTRLNYDARKRRFNEQAYGVAQNLGNTWLISYVVTLYSGPRRESHFGLRVQIDTVRF